MDLLVIGSGAREHTIARALQQSSTVATVYCLPGNPGMQLDGIQTVAIEMTDFAAMIAFVQAKKVAYTIVGPEQPLVAGVVDAFQDAGLAIFGPRKAAAALEGSKTFAKEIMAAAHVSTAAYQAYQTVQAALDALDDVRYPVVIKADGLAAGKGVVIAQNDVSARQTVQAFFEQGVPQLLIEDYLEGEEFSLMALVANNRVYPLPVAQDHKRAFDGDRGPNTGGMGAYCPVPQISDQCVAEAVTTILEPIVATMAERQTPFTGVLYAGLIATQHGVKVIEFNVRFGDPETQVVLPRMTGDWAQVFAQLLKGETPTLQWQLSGITLGVVVASDGYPTQSTTPFVLPTLQQFAKRNSTFSFASVAEQANQLVSAGGRLYTASYSAETLGRASQQVYRDLAQLALPTTFYRQDIGFRTQVK